jgi:hypothetical protein
VCTCAFAALVVVGTRPFGLDDPGSIWGTVGVVLVVVGLAAACFAKGRVLLGVIGLFVPFVALAGAGRLARPGSLWASRRYDDAKQTRSAARFAASRPLERAGGGSPTSSPGRPVSPRPSAATAAAESSAGLRRRAAARAGPVHVAERLHGAGRAGNTRIC